MAAILLLPPVCACCQEKDQTFFVIGHGDIHGTRVDAARDRAVADSLLSALQNAAAALLPREALIQHFRFLNDSVFNRPDDFLRGYRVLTEARSGDQYRVLVEAVVMTRELQRRLVHAGMLAGRKALPRVVLCIVEQRLHNALPAEWNSEGPAALAETAVAEVMRTRGFTIIDRFRLQGGGMQAVLSAAPDFSDSEAVEFGRQVKADVVVIGKASAMIAPNTLGENLKSFKGMADLRALNTQTGGHIAAVRRTAVTTDTNTEDGSRSCLKDAAAAAGEGIVERLLAEWQTSQAGSAGIELAVSGTRNLKYFVAFRQAVSALQGVQGLSVEQLMPNDALLSVDFEGPPEQLAQRLLLQTFGAFGLRIAAVESGRITVELVDLQPPEARGTPAE